MKKNFKIILLFTIITLVSGVTQAQETLINLQYNPVLKKFNETYKNKLNLRKRKNITADTTTIQLPFYDDFSKPEYLPDTTLWSDDSAFVNYGYTGYYDNFISDTNKYNNPPTIGVVTLDALNSQGDVYDTLLPRIPAIADRLTSKPINLKLTTADNVYLSFYYQATTVGNTPEPKDSLILEFYSPVDSAWHWIWDKAGNSDKAYKMEMIPISDTIFLKSGFRFRFKNYASLGSNYEPSWMSNVDQWNLDNIYLDKNRTANDTTVEDASMLYPIKSVLKNRLEAMPWSHFKANGAGNMVSPNITFIYRNLSKTQNWGVNHYAKIYDLWGNTPMFQTDVRWDNLLTDRISYFAIPHSYSFISSSSDSADFLLKCYIEPGSVTMPLRLRYNDTTYYHQTFKNYYAYDDGSSEAGYGISGEGSMNARIAYRFKNFKRDTLRGIHIYFNNTMKNYTKDKYYYLTVWNDKDGLPGDTLISQVGFNPSFSGGLNEFIFDTLNRPIVIDSGAVFYVGTIQTTNDLLNIGFDYNRDAHANLFYNISGTWMPSAFRGALMIRPWFGKGPFAKMLKPGEKKVFDNISVMPNPSSDQITLNCPENADGKSSKVAIFNIYGTEVMSSCTCNSTISVSHLTSGVYFLKVTDSNGYTSTKKILISR